MARFLSLVLFVLASMASGCLLDRSGLGCPGLVDDAGRCVALADADTPPADAGGDAMVIDAGPLPRDAGRDAGFDAAMPDPDGGTDAGFDAAMPDPDGGTDAGFDAAMPPIDAGSDAGRDAGSDAGSPDACMPSTEVCNGRDDDCGGDIDEGGVCRLRITFNAATATTGIFFRVAWNGPGGPEFADYFEACVYTRSPGSVTCAVDVPELAGGRIIRFFPVNDMSGAGACTAATCPSLCTRTGCPGFPPMGTYAYAIAFTGLPVLEGELTLNPDPGSSSDGPMPGDSAWLEFRLP